MLWTCAVVLTLLLLGGQAAWADGDGLVLWDSELAAALDRLVTEPGKCPSYARSANTDPHCAQVSQLLRREKGLTDLDRFVLFVDRYANARLEREISDGIEVDFRADVPDVLRQKIDLKIRLEIDF